MKKLGFIGCGKMASAIIGGVLKSNFLKNTDIIASEVNEEIAKIASERLNIEVICDNKIVAKNSEILFIATKPHFVQEILEEIKPYTNKNQLIISIAAGFKIEKIENILPENPIIRVMPNAPLMFLEGMSGIAKGSKTSNEQQDFVVKMLSNLGKCVCIEEKFMNTVTAISGSSPAFFFKIIEEIARAGEKLGIPYEKSLILSAQTALGSAKMILDSGLTVDELIKIVSTKGGCTEVGNNYLDEINIKNLMYNLIAKTEDKASKLG